MSDHSGHGGDAGSPEPAYVESAYRDRRYAYREDAGGFDLRIDGRSLGHMVGRLGEGRYHSHILPFSEFSTPQALAEALIDVEGEAWTQEEGEPGPGEGGHGGHMPGMGDMGRTG
jgi:hypothetical protein